jgi:hypothetical protein
VSAFDFIKHVYKELVVLYFDVNVFCLHRSEKHVLLLVLVRVCVRARVFSLWLKSEVQ